MQAEDTEWHQGTGWLRHTLIAFREGRDPCAEVKGGSESCRALPEPGQLSWGVPEDRCLRRSLYFWGRSAAANPGDHLDRDEAVPDFLSPAPMWLCQTPTP